MERYSRLTVGRLILYLLLIATLALAAFYSLNAKDLVTYNDFVNNINEKKYTEVQAVARNSGTTDLVAKNEKNGKIETATTFNQNVSELIKTNETAKKIIKMNASKEESSSGFSNYIAIGISLVLLFMFMNLLKSIGNNGPKGAQEFGKSRAKLVDPNKKKVTFNDVAGAEEEKESLREIVDFLKNPEKFNEMGARIPKGVLMVGPPGTGKTLLARAVAGEANTPFYSISGSDFLEMFVGVGASRVRDLFKEAKKNAPCLVFIDEIDAIGRARGAGFGGGHDEREQTLNQILVEMDGFEGNTGIIMMAATNRVDILDPALLRPGRFDRTVRINPPDSKGRLDILKIHTRNKPLGDDVDLELISKSTIGFTGAELENLANEAALIAVKENSKYITNKNFEDARNVILLGPEKKSAVVTEKSKNLTAYHEAGHAIVGRVLPGYHPISEISIVPRGGGAGGYTMHLPTEENDFTAKQDLIDDLTSLLGGRCAESLILKDISTGAKSDIDRASKIARAMVMDFGMSEKIGNITFEDSENVFMGKEAGRIPYSPQMGNLIDSEVKDFIDTAYNKAYNILVENEEKLHLVAKELLKREVLKGYEFEALYSDGFIKESYSNEEIQELNNKLYKGHKQIKTL